jgi:MFS transporter, AAHS family, 4-hydroxybenzoate transporter
VSLAGASIPAWTSRLKVTMNSSQKLAIEPLIDASCVGRFQATVIVLCALVAMADGFDTQAIAFVAPEIATAWGIAPSAFGMTFGAGLLGGLVGAMIFGMAGDRVGRKPTLLVAVCLFAVSTLVTPLVENISQLNAVRFITGLGLGGAVPSFIALTSEYAPKRFRVTIVGVMFCGFPLGAVLGGATAAKLIPAFGWQSVFIAGGLFPLLILPLFMALVPESVRFLAIKRDKAAILRVLARMKLAESWDGSMDAPKGEDQTPVARLFTNGKAAGTVLIWATLFLSLLMTYFLINWIPMVARQSGLSIQASVIAVVMLNFGAIAGCLFVGRLVDRYGPVAPISTAFALGSFAIAAISYAGSSSAMLFALTFVTGFMSIGAQMCTVALCASFYDTAERATGVGWSIGVGRVGAIVGPVLGGVLLAAGAGVPILFLIVGLTSLGAALSVLALGRFALSKNSAKLESSAGSPAY